MSSTRAIILAAGRGSRMRGLTQALPKCLLPLLGQPLLEWQLAALRAAGLKAITVVRGYEAACLTGAYDTVDNPRWHETNMVQSLLAARTALEAGTCVISYGDIVYHPDHVEALLAQSADIALTYDLAWLELWSDRFEDPMSDAETFRIDADGKLQEIGGKTENAADIEGQYMGLLRFTQAGFRVTDSYLKTLAAAELDSLDMTSMLRGLLDQGVSITGVPVRGAWCEADDAGDLALYERRIAEAASTGRPWTHDWR